MSKYLEYRYPGEAWQRIYAQNNGSLYHSIEEIKGVLGTLYIVKGRATKNGLTHCDQAILDRTWQITLPGPIYGIRSAFYQIRNKYTCENRPKLAGTTTRYLSYISHGSNPSQTNTGGVVYYDAPHTHDKVAVIDSVTLLSGEQAPTTFAFKVFEDGVQLFSRSDVHSPDVEYGNECPPNTCAVDCGTHVCCYNSQGISVFNYLK